MGGGDPERVQREQLGLGRCVREAAPQVHDEALRDDDRPHRSRGVPPRARPDPALPVSLHRIVARARAGHRTERGFVMIWFALMLITLIGFAGLSIEFNRWQNIGTRVQKAADAAALAGAVFLPDNLAG